VTREARRQPGPGAGAGAFDELMAEVMASSGRFGHREHVHLTWLAVRLVGVPAAIELVSEGIQRTARYAGAPQKYHATVSRAWVEVVGYHVAQDDVDDFAGFASRYPALLSKRLLNRHYSSSVLASSRARAGWVEPDLVPFPWQDATRRDGAGSGAQDRAAWQLPVPEDRLAFHQPGDAEGGSRGGLHPEDRVERAQPCGEGK
jgi:hypothetical protein